MSELEGFKKYFSSSRKEGAKYLDTEIVSLYLHNPQTSVLELASQSGISTSEFYRILGRYGVKPSRLNAQNGLVKSYHENGYSVFDIARMTGYTPRNVRYILTKSRKNETGA